MPSIGAEECAQLIRSVERLLGDQSRESDVRRAMESERGYDAKLWRELADLGVLGLIVDPEHGGAGAGATELELVMERAGAALLCSPYLSSAVLATALLNASGDEAAKGRLLPAMAAGETIATVALTGKAGTWTREGVEVVATAGGEGRWALDGAAHYVTHAQIADLLLVVAKVADGFGIFEVAPAAAGLRIAPAPAFDMTQRLARLDFTAVEARRVGTAGWETVQIALDMTLVALAGEQAGAARHLLDMTVEYGKSRIQFGRQIASFQALKHMAADLLLDSESAISAARHAAMLLDEGSAEADAAVSLAAFACADAFTSVAATSIQMHGGIAFTWEHPAHLYFRRARADAELFGSPALHRERYLAHLGA
jgi:alkylation response protein AidB-like acyl-CoA dehydrogenase